MDVLDLRILRRVLAGVGVYGYQRPSNTTVLGIAKHLGVDEGTVRNRIQRWREVGFLKGWELALNPAAVGLLDADVRLDVFPPSAKEDVIRKIRLVEGVYLVKDYLGSAIPVELLYPNEEALKRKTELIARMANSDNLRYMKAWHPMFEISLAEADMKILKSMHDSPWNTAAKTAAETGLSTKTVVRRLRRMDEGNTFTFYPLLDYFALKGMTRGDLTIGYKDLESKRAGDREILELGDEWIMVPHFQNPGYTFVAVLLSNIFEGKRLLERAKSMSGTTTVTLDLIQEYYAEFHTFRELLTPRRVLVKSS